MDIPCLAGRAARRGGDHGHLAASRACAHGPGLATPVPRPAAGGRSGGGRTAPARNRPAHAGPLGGTLMISCLAKVFAKHSARADRATKLIEGLTITEHQSAFGEFRPSVANLGGVDPTGMLRKDPHRSKFLLNNPCKS